MPMKVTNGTAPMCKEFGVVRESTGTVVGWELDPKDENLSKACFDAQIVLQELPKKLILKMDKP